MKWTQDTVYDSFANLVIQPKITSVRENEAVEESQAGFDSTVCTEERISMVRRRFIHIKHLARNKNPTLNSSVRIEDVTVNPSDTMSDETAEEVGLSTPPYIMNAIVWNCRGIGHPSTIRSLKILLKHHRPHFIFLSEIKCSDINVVQQLVRTIHFDCFELVLASGKAGGLLLAWQSNCSIQIVMSSTFLINCLLFHDISNVPWQLTLVYGLPTYH